MAEAAGIALAVFPLIIKGLHAYVDGVDKIKKWRDCKTIERMIDALEMEWTKCQNTCERLLEDCVAFKDLDMLLADPGGEEWREPSLRDSFRACLGRSFDSFTRALEDMKDTFAELADRLGLDAEYKPKWLKYNTLKQELKKLRLTFREDALKGLIERLRRANQDIADLVGYSQRSDTRRPIKIAASAHEIAASAKRYQYIQNQARNLYSVLKHKFSWPCGCTIPHSASLCIERRNGIHEATIDLKQGLHFNVIFSFTPAHCTNSMARPWEWREARIEPLNSSHVGTTTLVATTAMTTSHNSQNFAATDSSVVNVGDHSSMGGLHGESTKAARDGLQKVPSSKSVRPKSVSFASPESTRPKSPQLVNPLHSRGASISELQKIEDLCKAMRNARTNSCLGLLADKHENHHRVSIRSVSSGEPLQTVSLRELIGRAPLTLKERLILGVKLASTLLQLHNTPWLTETWGNVDIRFRALRNAPGAARLDQPFLSKEFSSPTCQLIPPQPIDPTPSPGVRNQSTFALGLVLTELWFGKPIDLLRAPSDLDSHNQPNHITDFATVDRLVDEIYAQAGDWYGDAVRRCVHCEFDQRHKDLDSEAFKEAVQRLAIFPLEQHLKAFCGGNFGDIWI